MLKVNKTMLYGEPNTFETEVKTFLNGKYAHLYDKTKVILRKVNDTTTIACIKVGKTLAEEIGEQLSTTNRVKISVLKTLNETLQGNLKVEFTKNFVKVYLEDGTAKFIAKAMVEFMM